MVMKSKQQHQQQQQEEDEDDFPMRPISPLADDKNDDDDSVMKQQHHHQHHHQQQQQHGCFQHCCRRFLFRFPHGWYSLLILVLANVGWYGSLFQDGCNFARIQGPIVQQLAVTSGNIPWLELGLGAYREPTWNVALNSYESTYTSMCLLYENVPTTPHGSGSGSSGSTSGSSGSNSGTSGSGSPAGIAQNGNVTMSTYDEISLSASTKTTKDSLWMMDTAWSTARWFAFLALVLGGGCTLFFTTVGVCCSLPFSKGTWKWTGYVFSFAALCQGMTFLWFTTEICDWNTCQMTVGAQTDLIAIAAWSLCGILMTCYYPIPITITTTTTATTTTTTTTTTTMILGDSDNYHDNSNNNNNNKGETVSHHHHHHQLYNQDIDSIHDDHHMVVNIPVSRVGTRASKKKKKQQRRVVVGTVGTGTIATTVPNDKAEIV